MARKDYNKLRKDYTDQIIGCWKVLSFSHHNNKRQAFWNIECSNCKFVTKQLIGYVKKCKKCRWCWLLPKSMSGLNELYRQYKRRADSNSQEFSLSLESFHELTSSPCHYCGQLPITISGCNRYTSNNHSTWGDYLYNGIDRKDNILGYSASNCVSCCEICNKAKRNLSVEEWNAWLLRLIAYNTP